MSEGQPRFVRSGLCSHVRVRPQGPPEHLRSRSPLLHGVLPHLTSVLSSLWTSDPNYSSKLPRRSLGSYLWFSHSKWTTSQTATLQERSLITDSGLCLLSFSRSTSPPACFPHSKTHGRMHAHTRTLFRMQFRDVRVRAFNVSLLQTNRIHSGRKFFTPISVTFTDYE